MDTVMFLTSYRSSIDDPPVLDARPLSTDSG
jgi:hypothetical protein